MTNHQDTGLDFTFTLLRESEISMVHEWLHRPHIAEWWGVAGDLAEVSRDFLPLTDETAKTQGFIARFHGNPIGLVQSYIVAGSEGGWWQSEKDPGARGIDLFLCGSETLGQGLGTRMIREFCRKLFEDRSVTKIQADPAQNNNRAIKCYSNAGFKSIGIVSTPDGPALLMNKVRPAAE